MSDLHCPTCNVELMGHEADSCLEEWLYSSMGFKRLSAEVWYENESQYWRMGISHSINDAYWFMERKIWKMDQDAYLQSDTIVLMPYHYLVFVEGPTLPVRVCRAGIYLATHPMRD